jgi:hypothetical protein
VSESLSLAAPLFSCVVAARRATPATETLRPEAGHARWQRLRARRQRSSKGSPGAKARGTHPGGCTCSRNASSAHSPTPAAHSDTSARLQTPKDALLCCRCAFGGLRRTAERSTHRHAPPRRAGARSTVGSGCCNCWIPCRQGSPALGSGESAAAPHQAPPRRSFRQRPDARRPRPSRPPGRRGHPQPPASPTSKLTRRRRPGCRQPRGVPRASKRRPKRCCWDWQAVPSSGAHSCVRVPGLAGRSGGRCVGGRGRGTAAVERSRTVSAIAAWRARRRSRNARASVAPGLRRQARRHCAASALRPNAGLLAPSSFPWVRRQHALPPSTASA